MTSSSPHPNSTQHSTLSDDLDEGCTSKPTLEKSPTSMLSTEARWQDAAVRAKVEIHRHGADEGQNTPKERWRRAAYLASRLENTDPLTQVERAIDVDSLLEKHLETQHWLELVDATVMVLIVEWIRFVEHMCCILTIAVVKWYHRRWQIEDTTENFFKWLDRGGGKDISLDECPREQLEKERIRYLSAEQRLNYLVDVDSAGQLRWHRNNELVDTTSGHWKDSGGQGIVSQDAPGPDKPSIARVDSFGSIGQSSSAEDENGTHYIGEQKGSDPITRTLWKYFTASGTMTRLLRRTVKRNTWIYVTDKNFNLFVGIKETGAFQHSSFLAGGLVTSAGLITVKHGVVHKLSPLSGHYRTSSDHFHKFLNAMSAKGVDMHKAKVNEAMISLWGIEHIKKAEKKKAAMMQEVKDAGASVAETTSDWKREILQGRLPKPQADLPEQETG